MSVPAELVNGNRHWRASPARSDGRLSGATRFPPKPRQCISGPEKQAARVSISGRSAPALVSSQRLAPFAAERPCSDRVSLLTVVILNVERLAPAIALGYSARLDSFRATNSR